MASVKNIIPKSIEDIHAFAQYARSAVELRTANMQGQRKVEYFKGSRFLDTMMTVEGEESKAPKGKPIFTDKAALILVGNELLRNNLIMKAEVVDKTKRILRPIQSNIFDEEGFYIWKYEGSHFMRNLLFGLMVLAVLGIVMFPVWPSFAKVGIWYISVTILIVLLGFVFVRWAIFISLWCVGFDAWILPNIFDDNLGFYDSFKPLYIFERAKDLKTTIYYRGAVCAILLAGAVWVYNQPSEFDDFVESQRQFVNDIYAGTLLSDKSEEDKQNIDKVIPDLSDLENMKIDEDETKDTRSEEEKLMDEILKEEETGIRPTPPTTTTTTTTEEVVEEEGIKQNEEEVIPPLDI